jgi:hypothetical protein
MSGADVSDDLVTRAGRGLEAALINDPDIATAVLNQPALLHLSGSPVHACSPHSQYVRK